MSGNLQFNKFMGAGLATVLVIVGVGVIADGIYAPKAPSKPGYAIEVVEAASGGGPEVVELLPDWGTILATADVAAGQAAFAKCMSCHVNDPGNANKTGPGLYGIVGKKVAEHAGFAYSDGLKTHATAAPVWTYDELYQFIKAPAKWVKGTKMGFAGIKKQEERVNLIAYLKSLGSTGYAIPAPDPTRQPGAAPGAGAAPAAGTPATPAAATPAATVAPTPAATPAPAA